MPMPWMNERSSEDELSMKNESGKASPQMIVLIVLAVIIAIGVSYIAYNQFVLNKEINEPSKPTQFRY